LRNDGRVWVPKKKEDRLNDPLTIKEEDRDYYLERIYPAFGNLVPRDVASRAAKYLCDDGKGVNENGLAVYLDFEDAINRLGEDTVRERYGNLFEMYEKISGENPYKTPMKIYPAIHYVMGGLWVDYNLETTVPGLFALGECNFSDHGANRLGASALMQGLADGYFVIPYTIGTFLSKEIRTPKISTDLPEFAQVEGEVKERIHKLTSVKGNQSVESFHRRLGKIMWDNCGMSRNGKDLNKARKMIQALREEFWSDVFIPGTADEYNPEFEKAWRVADFFELAENMIVDALTRDESCGGHFREEHQTEAGEAVRNDKDFMFVSAWEFNGVGNDPVLHKEGLEYNNIEVKTRSYK
jgi:succinate dehydrogenase / fumarate reductase flavoprotein subunit